MRRPNYDPADSFIFHLSSFIFRQGRAQIYRIFAVRQWKEQWGVPGFTTPMELSSCGRAVNETLFLSRL